MIETSQLQTLVAVAKAASFSKAAEDLRVTQSAISQSIKNLEKKIGVGLFKRSGKKVVLTPEGEKLYSMASDFIKSMDDTLEEITLDRQSMSGKVRIGTLNGVGKSWLASELMAFASENKQLSISLTLGFRDALVKEFENYRLDFLILPEEELPNVGEKTFLSEEKSTLVVPNLPEFESLTKATSLSDLCKYATVLFEERDPLYMRWCRERYGQTPRNINARYIINSHGNMLQAVVKGLGVAVVPTHVLYRSHHRPQVRTLGVEAEVFNSKFYLIYHKNSQKLLRINETMKRLLESNNPLTGWGSARA